MANIAVLKAELDTDSLGRGYAGMTDQQVASDLNTAYRTEAVQEVRSTDIFEALDRTEFAALTTENQARIDRILGLGDGIRIQDSNARSELLAIFGAGTTTRTNLAALQTRLISRSAELGLGAVTHQDVKDARNA